MRGTNTIVSDLVDLFSNEPLVEGSTTIISGRHLPSDVSYNLAPDPGDAKDMDGVMNRVLS